MIRRQRTAAGPLREYEIEEWVWIGWCTSEGHSAAASSIVSRGENIRCAECGEFIPEEEPTKRGSQHREQEQDDKADEWTEDQEDPTEASEKRQDLKAEEGRVENEEDGKHHGKSFKDLGEAYRHLVRELESTGRQR